MQITYNKHCEFLNVSLCLIGNTPWRNTGSGDKLQLFFTSSF